MKKHIISVLMLIFIMPQVNFSQTVLTLDKALEYASENSPSIIQSSLNLESSKAALEARMAGLKSNISLGVSPFNYSRSRAYDNALAEWNTSTSISSSGGLAVSQPIKQTDGTVTLRNQLGWGQNYSEYHDRTTKSFYNNLTLAFDQPLFTYNRTKMELENLQLNLENAQINYNIQQLNIEQSVTRYFYNVHSSLKSLLISEEELKNRQQSYEIIKNKVDAGLSAREELIQAEINMATSQANVYNGQVSVENAKDFLKQQIGLPLDDDIEVLAEISIDSVNVELQKAVDFALQNRMELRQREIDIKNAYDNLIRQKANNEFSGNMRLQMGLSGDNQNFGQIYDQPKTTPEIGFSFEIPVYDWGQRDALIRQANTQISASELSLKEERKSIVLNIRQIYRNLHNLKLQVAIKEKNIENAQLTYEINLERYRNGNLTSMDLNLVQNQLSSSKSELTSAIINYKLELLSLKIETLWDFENNKPVLDNKSDNNE